MTRLTRIRPETRNFDPDGSPISSHLTGRAWYRSEAWKPTVITQLSSSPETDQNAGDLSSKTRGQDPFSPPLIPSDFWHTTTQNLFHSLASSFSDQPRHLKRPDYRRSTTGKLADLEARFTAVAARGRSPPAPLDSLRFELSDLSFPSPSDEFQ